MINKDYNSFKQEVLETFPDNLFPLEEMLCKMLHAALVEADKRIIAYENICKSAGNLAYLLQKEHDDWYSTLDDIIKEG